MGRKVARVLGVVATAVGAGLLAWAMAYDAGKEDFRPPFGIDWITQRGEAVGWGVGFLVAGLLALWMGRTPPPPPERMK
jgi:hypothetical protein